MVISSAQGQFTFIFKSELGYSWWINLAEVRDQPSLSWSECCGGGGGGGGWWWLGIATVVVLQKSNDQPMVTLVGNVRYQPLTRQDRVSNCFT
jgi:hypothetical protein